MKQESIFTTPRRGLMGKKPLGVEYMPEVKERARRMKAATREEKHPPMTGKCGYRDYEALVHAG